MSGPEIRTGRPGPDRPRTRLDFDRCVPATSVHKTSDAEVLLTDAERLGDERFAVAALWSRDHYLAHHGHRAADPVLLAETARQAAIHLSHRFLDVPHGLPFVLSEIGVDLCEELPQVGPEPLRVELDVHCRPPAAGSRRLRLALDAEVLVGQRSFGRARVCWEPMEARRYALVRRRGGDGAPRALPVGEPRSVALAPADVGQLAERDTLIAGDPLRANSWWLRLDRRHPVLFDHESDHVPGMALVEAFRQAGHVTAGGRPGEGDATLLAVEFTAFGELHLPVSITARPTGCPSELSFTARQGEREIARATVRCGAPALHWTQLGAAC
ncbi:ScbA/BarX family gamma-butyrolactone biosynthesis protein [Streptomyces sp. NPDC001941]|uniref:ScbA/BarX family gamma-butyrolactone biosynthesis protein n=1 Tax=Streptomyces sp. NPDC001941 TaxID=3154659 RepID=UPI00331D1571